MSDHYETLGVPRDASGDQIRKAFRRKASKAHPDKAGGSTEEMAKLNRAISVIGDPAKRAEYDRTGSDDVKDPRAVGRDALMQFFDQAINQDAADPIAFVKQVIARERDAAVNAMTQAKAKLRVLQRKRKKVRTKGGAENIYELLLDRQEHAVKQLIGQVETAQTALAAATELLAAYEADPVEPRNARWVFISADSAQGAGTRGAAWPWLSDPL